MDLLPHIQAYFDRLAPQLDRWNKRNTYYYHYVDSLLAFFISPHRRILQVGTTSAHTLKLLKPKRGVSIAFTSKIADRMKQENTDAITVTSSDIASLQETFDIAVLADTLGYVSDIESLFRKLHTVLAPRGRLVITQYNQLWEPILELASALGLRKPSVSQNWLSGADIENFLALTGFETVKRGTKLLVPFYVPMVSAFFNTFLVNIFPFQRLGLVQYVIARPVPQKTDIQPSVSIIVPARNEAGTIEKIATTLPELGSTTEIIFIEGNSKDNTLETIKAVSEQYGAQRPIKYAVQEGRGKGDAVRKGFDMAEGDILYIYDADMTVPVQELEKFQQALVMGRGDFINGSRLVYPMEKQSMRTFNWIANKFFSLAFSWLLGQRIKDTLCGTKVLWREDYEEIRKNRSFFGDFDPFGDFDLLFGAAKLNLKIIDLPVHYKERTYGETNISRWRHGVLLLRMVLFAAQKIKFR